MPGSSPTMARREPTMRLNKVDFPTFGRPTMAMVGTPTVTGALIELELIRVKGFSNDHVGQWLIIETPWLQLLSPPPPALLAPGNRLSRSTNSSRPEACSRAPIPHTSFAADSFRWRK